MSAPVETYVEKDGTKWERVWLTVAPGMQQLVWRIVR